MEVVLNDVTQEHGIFPIAACYVNRLHFYHKILIGFIQVQPFVRVISSTYVIFQICLISGKALLLQELYTELLSFVQPMGPFGKNTVLASLIPA